MQRPRQQLLTCSGAAGNKHRAITGGDQTRLVHQRRHQRTAINYPGAERRKWQLACAGFTEYASYFVDERIAIRGLGEKSTHPQMRSLHRVIQDI